LAKLLIDPEDYEKAKKNYLTAIDIDENYAHAHYYLGKLLAGGLKNDKDGTLVRKPEYEDAIYHYKQTISMNKKYSKAHYNLALMYKIQKKYDDAKKHFEMAIEIVNDYSKAHFHLAMLLKETGTITADEKPSNKEEASVG
jgi:tetratricopeptide (TPR) repeat protein